MGYPVCLYGPVSYPKLRSGLTSIVTPTERNLRNSPENRVTRSAEKIVKHYSNTAFDSDGNLLVTRLGESRTEPLSLLCCC